MNKTYTGWSNRDLNTLTKYKSSLYDVEEQMTVDRLLNK